MLVVTLRTLASSSSPFLYNPLVPKPFSNPHPKCRATCPCSYPALRITLYAGCKSEYQSERGLQFETGESFFRHESATGRDLGVLAASLYRKSEGKLRVLDALCGCGVRSLRYLVEAEADFVLANDANEEYNSVICKNLSRMVPSGPGDECRWRVTNSDANRIMTECYLQRDFFDFIDVDSFGSDSSFLRSAMNALRLDGLLYVTSTDGFSSGGHRPHHSFAAYGAYIQPLPYSNEVGLRMLIGGAVREASVLGYRVAPLFSYYAYHGPVFRVLLRVNRGKLPDNRDYGFISYCEQCGNSQAFSWDELGQISCLCTNSKVSESIIVSGPLWTGPLHDTVYVQEMLNLAEEWGWTGRDTETSLEKVLKQMVDESDPRLPFGYIKLDEVASRAKINSPPLRTMMSAIQKEGYAASRSHIVSNAIKTNCPMTVCIRIAKELQQCCSAENVVS
ncbi:tRNA (guanine(26)-N(2))-dimethyltransferase isoform X1 [Ziziphus jujuba]|uniref:tRNA (guanine(26)-N(2))-dimethyltransferase n=1 Tax=Ziziphus jujuba TaxID=326968 RepID=A0A6P3ZQE1_ZIZJJ|nr:tRNA (guanine(26)-N(2))-dimethyltransferase isoform X1 [Ziziphus jujuba]